MREIQAYPDGSTFEQRARRKYEPGDLVEVGPPYVGAGLYRGDGHCGLHTVVGVGNGGAGPDYQLVKGDERVWVLQSPDDAKHNFDVWIHAARLTPHPGSE